MSVNTLEDNGFTLHPQRSNRYPASKITDADYTDDLMLFSNLIIQTETLLHCLEHSAKGIGHHVNLDITGYISLNQNKKIKTISGTPQQV